MPKEMIISVNGREKKVAIIEDGQVVEFYIERGEENTGLVGSIYKGRVSRVLPGMQSAFVEIGLERNAFLYVSDFFDEEEELERIMLEKTKKSEITEEVEREAVEQLKQARLEREQQIDEIQEIAEPIFEKELSEKQETKQKNKKQDQEKKQESIDGQEYDKDAKDSEIAEVEFERITDEDVEEESTGKVFKDDIIQEEIADEVRTIEFDIESVATAEVGSIFEQTQTGEVKLERIADEEEIEQEKPKKNRRKKAEKSVATEEKKSKKQTKTKKTSEKTKGKTKKKKLEDASAELEEPVAEMSLRRNTRRRGNRNRNRQRNRNMTERHEQEMKEESHIDSAENNGSFRAKHEQPTITDLLREGQEILVQIAKEPIARKGARITSHIALPGRYLVYMPTIEHIGVSRKIESASERARLRHLIQKIMNEEEVPSGGFIVRTAGIGASEEKLREDVRYLVHTWKDIKKQAEKVKAPALVYQDLDIVQRILRDHLSDDFTAIRVDNVEEYTRIVEFVNRINPKLVSRVKLYTRDEPIFEAYGIQNEIEKALRPRVWLKSGGYLVINQTEALVAIDVNTGKFIGKGNIRLEDTIFKTNMEAVEEIARQIRLRDLGGIIILDLIDMEDPRNRQKIRQALQEHLSKDKSPTKIVSFNDLGLVIMTRKRVKQSLERTLCSPCPYCNGSGWIKSAQTVCYNILEEARRIAKHLDDVKQVTLRVHPEIAKALRGEEIEVLKEIEDYLGPIDLVTDPSIHQEQFDFALI
ncbi:MAG: Rne/Rng family ribonuclease [Acidobacteriota bacterium]|nr:Rne/Rng family ribonuclease [Pyrinomonadaceae bacterium]MDW8304488.1 Rne/Rng family ribonuclease [Acidobacteriota bacterium]